MNRWIARAMRRVGAAAGGVDPGGVQTCLVRGHEIRLLIESPLEQFRANTYQTKEPETLDWLQRTLRPGDVLYDVGANIGLYSLFAAKQLGGAGRVYAFEPEALNHARLSQNIYVNGLSGVVIPCCLAICERPRFDRFNLNPASVPGVGPRDRLIAGSAMHSFGAAEDFARQPFAPFHQQGMFGLPLDDLWGSWGLEFPNHIKIDVDGLEDRIIDGAARTLEDARLRSLLIEFTDDSEPGARIAARLTQTGFREVDDFPSHSRDQLKGSPYRNA